jgi:hypothetical protein
MKLCSQCGASLAEDTVKCPQCGQWMVPIRTDRGRTKKRRGLGWLLLSILAGCAGWWIWLGPGLPTPPSSTGGHEAPAAPSIDLLRSDLETLSRLQEVYFQDRGIFAGLPSILGFTASEGVQVSIVSTGEAWSGTTFPAQGGRGRGCAVFVGSIPPPREPMEPSAPGRVECRGGPQGS